MNMIDKMCATTGLPSIHVRISTSGSVYEGGNKGSYWLAMSGNDGYGLRNYMNMRLV